MLKEINILGAGIAGLSCGITLANKGYNVNVYDNNKDILSKTSHYQAMRNYTEMDPSFVDYLDKTFEIKPHIDYSTIDDFIVYFGNKKTDAWRHRKNPVLYGVKRGGPRSLEDALLKRALQCDVNVHLGVVPEKKDIDIMATGYCGKKNHLGSVYGATYSDVNIGKNSVIVLLHTKKAPMGYFYILPHKENQCTVKSGGLFYDVDIYKKAFQWTIENDPVVKEVIDGATKIDNISGMCSFKYPYECVKDDKLYIGEAGGFQDPCFAFGIHYAFLTGYMAAHTIENKQDFSKMWKQRFLKWMRLRHIKRKVLFNCLVKPFGNSAYHMLHRFMPLIKPAYTYIFS